MYTDFDYLFLKSFPVLNLLSSLLDVSDNCYALITMITVADRKFSKWRSG